MMPRTPPRLRSAVTMFEIIMVIMVLGIVASIGSAIIADVYKSYIVERALYRATSKTELALNQIANRLRYAIPGTVGFRSSPTGGFKNIASNLGSTDKVLQWVAYDGESFEAIASDSDRHPGWSGFCDLNGTSGSTIKTPGSHPSLADTIIKNLGGTNGIQDTVLFFPDGSEHPVASYSAEKLILDSALQSGDRVYERYKLAWSSYALEVDAHNTLWLHYNFTPTKGADMTGSQTSVLLYNVTNFRFTGTPGSTRIKICKDERIGSSDANVTACKEKVIF